ncbi:MAG: energy-coupled thiamine transporter ThiT [Corallococcus sp.]|nr:energy-coupled thiamine transporter ThiT [Corallococcus sp.]
MKGLWEAVENGTKPVKIVDAVFDAAAEFMLYVTIALIAAITLTLVFTRKWDEQRRMSVKRTVLGVIIGYSVATIAVLGYIKMAYKSMKGEFDTNFYLFVGLLALLAVLTVAGVILRKKAPAAFKWFALGAAIAVAAYAVTLLCVMQPKEEDGHIFDALSDAGMYTFSALLVAVGVVLVVLFGKSDNNDSTKSVAYAAICISLSYALSYVKFFSLPQGGSVTFASLLPLMLYSYMFGARRGLVAGLLYGMLQLVQSPQVYHPMQVLLDYPIAFGLVGLAGIGRNFKFLRGNMVAEFMVGATIAMLLRYFAHVISGYYVFYIWAWEGYHALAYSFVYNLTTVADLAVELVAAAFLLSTRTMRNQIRQIASPSM